MNSGWWKWWRSFSQAIDLAKNQFSIEIYWMSLYLLLRVHRRWRNWPNLIFGSQFSKIMERLFSRTLDTNRKLLLPRFIQHWLSKRFQCRWQEILQRKELSLILGSRQRIMYHFHSLFRAKKWNFWYYFSGHLSRWILFWVQYCDLYKIQI